MLQATRESLVGFHAWEQGNSLHFTQITAIPLCTVLGSTRPSIPWKRCSGDCKGPGPGSTWRGGVGVRMDKEEHFSEWLPWQTLSVSTGNLQTPE